MPVAKPFDLVFVSLENWNEVWRRNQFLVAEMARRNPSGRTVFLGLPRNVTAWLAGRSGRPEVRSIQTAPDYPNVLLANSLKLFPNSWPWGQRINQAGCARFVRHIMRTRGLTRPLLWINDHHGLHLADSVDHAGLIYDITDDWTAFPQSEAEMRLTVGEDAELCRRANAVITCSPRLQQLKTPLATVPPYLIPNGVDLQHYVDGMSRPLPADARQWQSPVVGYVGTVHPDRVDLPLLMEVARALPQVTFVLIGPHYLTPTTLAQIEARPNVRVTGQRPYQDIPAYMRAFDVCMTPHRMTDFTESLNPIKLWEYLAVGKPIVSTDVAGFRDFPHLVRLASTAAEFATHISLALAEGTEKAVARRQEAEKNSWSQRVDAVLDVVEQVRSEAVHA